jgi:hypothetical protein
MWLCVSIHCSGVSVCSVFVQTNNTIYCTLLYVC